MNRVFILFFFIYIERVLGTQELIREIPLWLLSLLAQAAEPVCD